MSLAYDSMSNRETSASSEAMQRIVTFKVDGRSFGVDVASVREIKGWQPTTPLPNAALHVLGVINLRGAIIAVYDLRRRLGLGASTISRSSVVIVVDLGERLTEAVCKEIEKRTPFKVVGDPNADSVLTARIVADTKRMVVESPTDQSRQVEMNLQVLVTWADRGGSVLASGQVPLPAASVDVGQAAMLVPEFGRSVVSTQQEGLVKMAQQIVGLMEEPW